MWYVSAHYLESMKIEHASVGVRLAVGAGARSFLGIWWRYARMFLLKATVAADMTVQGPDCRADPSLPSVMNLVSLSLVS